MSIEHNIGLYTHEDVRQIAGGDDGFSFRGSEEHDPLGPLFAAIQNGDLLGATLQSATVSEVPVINSEVINTREIPVPQRVEVEL